mgnify:CR=1 FL=1
MENIGEKIMQARKTKGMTQDTLAQLVNVSRQTVSHWENGRHAGRGDGGAVVEGAGCELSGG